MVGKPDRKAGFSMFSIGRLTGWAWASAPLHRADELHRSHAGGCASRLDISASGARKLFGILPLRHEAGLMLQAQPAEELETRVDQIARPALP